MFIVHDGVEGFICRVDSETPNKGDILCLELYRKGIVYYEVEMVVRYSEQGMKESILSTSAIKAFVKRV